MMKIKEIRIQNFRSIKEETLVFPENGLLALIGPNNAGKSNFLKAIDLILGEYWSNKEKMEDYDFYCGNRDNPIKIEIRFTNGRKVIFNSEERWPQYFDKNNQLIYASQANIKNDFPCTYLSAERSISKEASFSKWSLMGKVSKSFNSALKAQGHEESLRSHFDEIKRIFSSVPAFQRFEDDFKQFFEEMQADSPYKLQIEFKPFTPNNYFRTLNIIATDPNFSGCQLDLEELGDGAKNLAIFSLLRSYAKNFRDARGILAIEEPEIYMHPQARRHLFQIFKHIADQSDIQIIYTTHDTSFLDISEFESIRRIYKIADDDGESRKQSKVKQILTEDFILFGNKTGATQGISKERLVEFYRSISNVRLTEGFFSRLIILGEGQTEELALPVYLKTCGIDCDRLGISVLGVGGKGEIPKYWRLFHFFDIPVIVVFDNDDTGDKHQRNKTIADCFSINQSLVVEEVDVFKHLSVSEEGLFEKQNLIILEKDFEVALRKDAAQQSIDIEALESSAKNTIVGSDGKPKQVLARWIAMQLGDKCPSYCPSFVTKIGELIREKLNLQEKIQSNEAGMSSDALPEIVFTSDIKPEDLPF